MITTLLHDTGEVQLHHRPGRSDFTLVIFGETTEQGGETRWWGQDFAERHDLDVLAFAARRTGRFPHAGVEALLPIARGAAKPRRVAFGSSMGGFWALKYASALGADAAVVFSPRASTDPADPLPGEPRSAPQPVPEAQTPQGIGPEDLPPCALVAYDSTEPTDAPQASHLGGMPGVRLVPMARAGRNPVRVLTGAEEADAVFALAGEGRLDEAARALRAMRHRSPHAWLGLGVSAHLAGKKARARRLFDQARRLGVRPKAILMAQAQAAIRARRPDYAAAALRRLRRLDPTDPRIPLALGQQLRALGHHAAAALAFRNAVAEEPDHLPGRLGLIEALERQGALKEALKAAEAAVAALPEAAALRARLDRARRALARSAKGIRPGTASGDAATAPAGGRVVRGAPSVGMGRLGLANGPRRWRWGCGAARPARPGRRRR